MVIDNLRVRVRRHNVVVEIEHIGEGLNGDYNPNDPEDKRLLRFTVLVNEVPVDDASYCTLIPADAPKGLQFMVAKKILGAVYAPIINGKSIKRLCEKLSWLREDVIDAVIDGATAVNTMVYVVEALRWGEDESHHYIVSVHSEKPAAEAAATAHSEYRGGKYSCVVWECQVDSDTKTEVFRSPSMAG
jgi:hypothetical protein